MKGGHPIAIYHYSIKVISRGKGKSAVAAAAYRSGEKITNEYDGITHDYTRKGGIAHSEIQLPENAPPEYLDRATLWNAVEEIEKNRNSQLAREIELALPVELSKEQNIELVRAYCQKHFIDAGMCADICIHDKKDGNPHAHVMLTMRPINDDKTWGSKQKKAYILDGDGNKTYDKKKRTYKCKSVPTTDWNEQTKAEEWRSGWSVIVNQYLDKADVAERVDHRSYERQGIEQIPTVHLGVAAFQMEKRGISTERGDINREIEVTNKRLRQLKARISKLQNWLKNEATNTKPPTLADVIQGILSRREQTGKSNYYQSIGNLKAASKMLNFLTAINIMDMAGLEEKVQSMYGKQYAIRDKLKPIERRLKVLDEHIKQADIYQKYKSKVRTESEEITFTAAKKYITNHLNGYGKIPYKSWGAERTKLTIARNRINQEYISLKEEVKEVEKIRRNIYDIMREETHRELPTRKQDMEL
ncbi:MAG: MobQ family relaxase [Sporomusa sp.]